MTKPNLRKPDQLYHLPASWSSPSQDEFNGSLPLICPICSSMWPGRTIAGSCSWTIKKMTWLIVSCCSWPSSVKKKRFFLLNKNRPTKKVPVSIIFWVQFWLFDSVKFNMNNWQLHQQFLILLFMSHFLNMPVVTHFFNQILRVSHICHNILTSPVQLFCRSCFFNILHFFGFHHWLTLTALFPNLGCSMETKVMHLWHKPSKYRVC